MHVVRIRASMSVEEHLSRTRGKRKILSTRESCRRGCSAADWLSSVVSPNTNSKPEAMAMGVRP